MDDVKSLKSALREFMEENKVSFSSFEYTRSWPIIAGPSLSSCTEIKKLDLENGKIHVSATSPSAKALLIMEKKRIIRDWNERFPEKQISQIVVPKRT